MKFSVLISVYYKENPEYLDEALKSILDQTLQPDEIVLIEDGELTPELYKILDKYEKIFRDMKRYSFLENKGLGVALAEGVKLCNYDLIARMDTDDIAVKERFEIQKRYMEEHPQISICGGLLEEFNDCGNIHQTKFMPEDMESIKLYAKYRNPLNHMTVMFRKDAVLSAGNYHKAPYLEDYDLWSRMLTNGEQFYNIQCILVKARVSNSLYNRRGGVRYCGEYLKLRKRQKQWGLLNGRSYIQSCLITILITIIPVKIRKKIYVDILRKKR